MRGVEPQCAVVISAIAYLIQPDLLGKGETLMFFCVIWLAAILLIYGVEDQIERFRKRAKRRRIRRMKKQKKPELADIRIYREAVK